jgi:lambda family phage portal protein
VKRRKPAAAEAPVVAAGPARATARYDAAGNGRRIKHWSPPATGPRKALEGLERLRSRVHDAVRNDWAAESATGKWVSNLIGVGIQPRFKNRAHREIWDTFAPTADADGVLDVYGQQALGTRSLFDGGEVFLRRRPREIEDGRVPVQVQLIESEYCPMLDADTYQGLPRNHVIRQGIELDRRGQRAAYWFYKAHPGDGDTKSAPGADQLVRVAASQVRHLFVVRRPGQLRGVSDLATVLARLRASGDLEDTTLDRQKLANLFALFITRQLPDANELDIDPLTGLPKFYDTDGGAMAGLEPGIAQELRPGEDVKFAQPPSPGATYGEFVRGINLGSAAGVHMPYELLTGDIKDVSDRTLRVVINEFRRICQQRQWLVLIPTMCRAQVEWCMDAAALAGMLPLDELAAAKRPTWVPHGWEYIHPTQDADGKKTLVEIGALSVSQIITERGDDPEEVRAQREADAASGLAPAPAPAPAPAVDQTAMLRAIENLQAQNAAIVDALRHIANKVAQ